MAAKLTLSGTSELVVKMALIAYLESLEKLQKAEAKNGVESNTDVLVTDAKDILKQLGYVPAEKSVAEVTRVDPRQGHLTLEVKGEKGPKVFDVQCPSLSCREKFQARGTTATCPKCAEVYEILADEDGQVVRLNRKKKKDEKK